MKILEGTFPLSVRNPWVITNPQSPLTHLKLMGHPPLL